MNKQLSYSKKGLPGNSNVLQVYRTISGGKLSPSSKYLDNEEVNLQFNSAELQEHAEKNPGRWKLLHEYPNRQVRRSILSAKNLRRFNNSQLGAMLEHDNLITQMKAIKEQKETIDQIHQAIMKGQ
jgi:hypothetical protein